MAIALGARLVQTCEQLCEDLRRSVGLSSFRIQLDRRPTPLVVTLRPGGPLLTDPRHEWMRPPVPATLESILVHDGRRVGVVRLQDECRSSYPSEAVAELHRILPGYAAELAHLLEEGQL